MLFITAIVALVAPWAVYSMPVDVPVSPFANRHSRTEMSAYDKFLNRHQNDHHQKHQQQHQTESLYYTHRYQQRRTEPVTPFHHMHPHPHVASHRPHTRRDVASVASVAAIAPPPCQPMSPPPDEAGTKARFDAFAHAFLVTKNITEAFTYIADSYINHNPAARNGAASAWSILSPIWGSQSITVLRTTFKDNTGWLNYRSGGLGEVVDRYRWDAGCIMEHWDQGEKYPSDAA